MERYAENLEAEGHHVHLPHRDVDQTNDDGGVRICQKHVAAMAFCDEVHVWLLPGQGMSEGSFFDFGMAFMLSQFQTVKFRVVNGPLQQTEHKSFQNLLKTLVEESE
jgi:hypothetical protein